MCAILQFDKNNFTASLICVIRLTLFSDTRGTRARGPFALLPAAAAAAPDAGIGTAPPGVAMPKVDEWTNPSLCRKRCRASVSAASEGLAAVAALARHMSRHRALSCTIAHA